MKISQKVWAEWGPVEKEPGSRSELVFFHRVLESVLLVIVADWMNKFEWMNERMNLNEINEQFCNLYPAREIRWSSPEVYYPVVDGV